MAYRVIITIFLNSIYMHSVQFSLVVQSCPTLCDPWIAARQVSLSITNSWSSLRLMSIESVMPSSHLILCRPLLLLPPIPPSIGLFQWVTLRMRWPKHWSFSFSIIPSKEIPGLISFRMDWLDLLSILYWRFSFWLTSLYITGSMHLYKCFVLQDHPTCSWEICMQVRKPQLELDIEKQTGSK